MRTMLLVLSIAALAACDQGEPDTQAQDAANSSSTVLAQPTGPTTTDQSTGPTATDQPPANQPSTDPTRADTDDIVGSWVLDRDAMIDRILEDAKANGRLPAEADRDHPDALPLIEGLDEMRADITIRTDGTWEAVTAQAGAEPTRASGTWRNTGAGYEFTQTAADGVEVPALNRTASLDDNTLTWNESSMTTYVLEPA